MVVYPVFTHRDTVAWSTYMPPQKGLLSALPVFLECVILYCRRPHARIGYGIGHIGRLFVNRTAKLQNFINSGKQPPPDKNIFKILSIKFG